MKKHTLGSKILAIYFTGCLAVIFISIVGIVMLSNHIYTRQMVAFCENVVGLNLNLVNRELLSIQQSQRLLVEDPAIKQIMKYRNDTQKLDYAIELYNQRDMAEKFQILMGNMQIESAYIVDDAGKSLYWYKAPLRPEEIAKQEWYQDVLQNIHTNISYISEIHDRSYLINPSNEMCISMVMPITFRTQRFQFMPEAYLICDVNLNSILDIGGSDIDFAFLSYENNLHFFGAVHGQAAITKWMETQHFSEPVGVHIIKQPLEDDLLIVSMKTNFFGFQLIGIKPLTEMHAIRQQIVNLSSVIVCTAMFFVIAVTRKTVVVVVKPMNQLMSACNQIAEGNYNITFAPQKIQEMNVFSDTIQTMIANMIVLNQRAIEEEKKFSEQKLIALQHQINPHFINNVLQSIKALALLGENQKISEISTRLGKVMAYSVYRPYESVTLKEEFTHIQNYLEVQRIRYDNQIHYCMECSAELESVRVPKLTLQPIVENAVEHGMKCKEPEFITITAEEEGEVVCILVHDTGKGISGEKIQALQHKMKLGQVYQQENSVGILNVHERIRKKFGEAYGLEVISREGSGTTVVIKIPKIYEEKTNDEGIIG